MANMQAEDFPILCETCLGDNPYLRMTRERFAKGCKICDRPFTVYRWRPGPRARFKKTEICGTCAKLKNVCQTCILDLQYGLPVQVRDEALLQNDANIILNNDALPVSHTNRNYMYEQLENQIGLGGNNTSLQLPYNNIDVKNGGNNMLNRIQRRGPYYKRNLPHICSFYVKGTCNRGESCPYRHVLPDDANKDNTLKDQNIKDRFYGVNDPVAKKLLNKYKKWTTGVDDNDDGSNTNNNTHKQLPQPPNDVTIRTLFIGGIDWSISEDHIRSKFNNYGSIASVVVLHDKKCGFITFGTREIAETVMKSLFDMLYLNKKKCDLNWARSKNDDNSNNNNTNNANDNTNDNVDNKDDNNDNNDLDINSLSKDDKEYLKKQGIVAPDLPPMPDPCASTSYTPSRSTQYKSMTTHYKESKVISSK